MLPLGLGLGQNSRVGASLRPGIPDFKAISKSLLASASNWKRTTPFGETRLGLNVLCVFVCYFCPWTSTSTKLWSYQKWLVRVELYYLTLFVCSLVNDFLESFIYRYAYIGTAVKHHENPTKSGLLPLQSYGHGSNAGFWFVIKDC